MKKRVIFVLNTLAWMLLALSAITIIIQWVGLDSDLYYALQMRENVPESAGISKEDLRHLDRNLAFYLDGYYGSLDAAEDESLVISVNGVMQPAFNEREILHMKDCRHLFDLLDYVSIACRLLFWIVITCRLMLRLCCRTKQKMKVLPGPGSFWLGSAVILLPLAVLALWAAIDFNSAFNFFHRILFTNDLWLLNPRTDLLIRICPQSMFANMGLRIALLSAAVLLGLPLVATILSLIFKKRKKDTNEIPQI